MPAYANASGKSNVTRYEIRYAAVENPVPTFDAPFGFGLQKELAIEVTFADGRTYAYTETSAGADNVRKMIELAEAGSGLNGFINKNVKYAYARKFAAKKKR